MIQTIADLLIQGNSDLKGLRENHRKSKLADFNLAVFAFR